MGPCARAAPISVAHSSSKVVTRHPARWIGAADTGMDQAPAEFSPLESPPSAERVPR